MDCYNDPRTERIVCCFASQTSKTEGAVLNPLGYFVQQDPSNIMVVEPREFDAKKCSKKRLSPMIRDTQVLADLVRDPKSRDSSNTILEKEFPGGSIVLAGANSPAGLAGDPIRILLLNEVSRFPLSAGSEGDPVAIAEMRTETYPDRKIGMNSSPTDEGRCRITAAYEESDQRQYHVPCPHCGVAQVLRWDNVRWDKDAEGESLPETARYVCPDCGQSWTEAERHEAVRNGEWIAQKPFDGTAGFHLNALYAPWANSSLPSLVRRWLNAQGKPLRLKAFINTVLAEVWSEKYETVSHDLSKRLEDYPERAGVPLVPKGVVVIVAGVDTQDDRLEVHLLGVGRNDEIWVLQYHILYGDPSASKLWDDAWGLLCSPLAVERGGVDYVRAIAVDTGGHHTLRAYEFCRPRQQVPTPDGGRAFVFAIKGQGGALGDIWPRRPNFRNKGKIPLYNVRVDPAKDSIYTSLQRNVEPGPGYIHFPRNVASGKRLDDSYFEQLTAEKRRTAIDKNGFEKRVWELKKEGARNEVLDTTVYGIASYYGLCQWGFDLELEAEELESRPLFEAPTAGQPAPSREQPLRRPASRRPGWVGSRRDWLRG